MYHIIKRTGLVAVTGLALSGCATLSPMQAFEDTALTVQERTGKRIQWDQGSPDDIAARAVIAELLRKPITMKSATQIALLNNRALQAVYTDLGIAQAELVQAGLLKNPAFDLSIIDPVSKGLPVNLTFGAMFQFIDALYIPLRRRVAKSRLEEAKITVAAQVIDHAAMTQMAFVDYLAARQLVGLFRQVEKAARASFTAARALREAGNTTELDFETQQNLLTQTKLDLAQAEAALIEAREKLNAAMGLTGHQTRWRTAARLPDLPARSVPLRGIEKWAVKRSLNLALLRQRLVTLGHQYGLKTATSIIPDLEVGFEIERDGPDKEWRRGPKFAAVLPIFDQGQAKRKIAEMQIRKAQARYWDTGVRVRSAARAVAARVKMARQQVYYYQRAALPQATKILTATQRQYNAMQLGVFRLLIAKQNQIQTGQRYVQALQAYWRARIQHKQLYSGRLPAGGTQMMVAQASNAPANSGGH